MREKIETAMREALKARDTRRTATLRMVSAAIKDREIALRGEGKPAITEDDILAVMQKMVKQREESAGIYAQAGRSELEAQERAEIEILREFLPQPLGAEETEAAIAAAIAETGAETARDMGKVIAALKSKYTGRMDFGQVSRQIKEALGG